MVVLIVFPLIAFIIAMGFIINGFDDQLKESERIQKSFEKKAKK